MNLLDRFVQNLKAEFERLRSLDWTPPEPPPEPQNASDFKLKPLYEPSQLKPRPNAVSIENVRERLPELVAEYITGETGKALLLVKVPAGVGKTHALSQIAQDYGRNGKKVLWAAARHNAWDDLQNFAHFDYDLWHHWLGAKWIREDNVPMCEYGLAMEQWQRRGYPTWKLCRSLCEGTGHIHICPYANQSSTEKPCIMGMHNHLITGMDVGRFSMAIVDELAIQALIRKREIPTQYIVIPSDGPVLELLHALKTESMLLGRGGQSQGKALFDKIGPILRDVYAQVEVDVGALPQLPNIGNPNDVLSVPYWFLNEFLFIAAQEYEAWRNGWDNWAARVLVTDKGLQMISKPDLWDKLPYKLIALDATGQKPFYERLYQRPVTEYAPSVKHIGEVHQIAGRLNSKKSLYRVAGEISIQEHGVTRKKRKISVSRAFNETVAIIEHLKQKHHIDNIGIVCYQDVEGKFKAAFPESTTRHFYDLRGTNNLQDVKMLFVVGTPTPHFREIINIATALDTERRLPYGDIGENGKIKPLYKPAAVEFRLNAATLQQLARREGFDNPDQVQGVTRIVGTYTDADLAVVKQQLSQAELIQALHRARINVQDTLVYLLTATPTDEVLDGLYNDPPIGPAGMYFKIWLRLQPILEQFAECQALWVGDLARLLGYSEKHVKNERWLDMLLAYYEDCHGPQCWYPLRKRDPRNESTRGRIPLAMIKGVDPAMVHVDDVLILEEEHE